jgi:hypothetical protein
MRKLLGAILAVLFVVPVLQEVKKMADKSTVTFALKAFKLNLSLMPNFQMLKKSIRDMLTGLPKKVVEATKADGLLKSFDEYAKTAESNPGAFQNALDGFGKWADSALEWVDKQNPDDLVAQRGRQGEQDTELELFGTKQLTSLHAGSLIAGSKLQQIFQTGLPEGFNEWDSLIKVTNKLRGAIFDLIPTEKRPKKAKKDKDANTEGGNVEGEGSGETEA